MYVRGGGDIAKLNVATLTKAALRARSGPPRPPSARRLKARIESQLGQMLTTIDTLGSADKMEAITEIQAVMEQLASRLLKLEGRKAPVRAESSGPPRVVPRGVEVTRHRVAATP